MNTRRLEVWILLADLAWIGAAFLGADLLRYGLMWAPRDHNFFHGFLPFIVATALIWIALSAFMPMDGFRGGWKFSAVVSQIFLGTACTSGVLLTLGYLSRSYVSRLALGYFVLLLVGGFLGVRCAALYLLRLRHEGGFVWRVVILGSGRVAQEVAAKIEQHPEMLCKVVGLLFPNQDSDELIVPGLQRQNAVQLSTLSISDLLRRLQVNEVIVALSQAPSLEIRTLINRIRDMGVATTLVPQSYELYASRTNLVALDGLPLLQLREPGLRRRYRALKRVLDLAVASVLLLPSFVFLAPFAAVLLLKKGRAFRWEMRCGQYGALFRMLRLNVDRPLHTDSSFERFLEHSSLTELPQLWNVLRGQMSLVGPRPDPPQRLREYSEWQQHRLKVKPGMTGLAQVHGLRQSSSPERKTRFDLQYAVNPYLLWDISLLLQTVWTLVRRSVAPAPHSGTFDVQWTSELPQDVISNAHRTQSSAD